jgi:hypothetical protein
LLDATVNVPRNLLCQDFNVPTDAQVAEVQRAVSGAVGTSGGAGCSALLPTSPLNRLPYGPVTFYWDGVEGAANYLLYIQPDQAPLLGPYETGSSNTNITLDANMLPGGPNYTWYVVVVFQDGSTCTSGSAQVVRDLAPAGEIPVVEATSTLNYGPGRPHGGPAAPATDTPAPVPTGGP